MREFPLTGEVSASYRGGPSGRRGAKVLVIDDDPLLRAAISAAFACRGYASVSAGNGVEGMELFDAEAPALVVTDIVMPEKDGISTIIDLKRAMRPPKIIAISGGGSTCNLDYLSWARHLGADQVMAKPFQMSALIAAGQELLAS